MGNRSEAEGMCSGRETQQRCGEGGPGPPACKQVQEQIPSAAPRPEHGFPIAGLEPLAGCFPPISCSPRERVKQQRALGGLPGARCCRERSSQPHLYIWHRGLEVPLLPLVIRCHVCTMPSQGMRTVLESARHGQSQGLLSCHCSCTACLHRARGPGHISGAAQLPVFPTSPPFILRSMQRGRGEQGVWEEAKHPIPIPAPSLALPAHGSCRADRESRAARREGRAHAAACCQRALVSSHERSRLSEAAMLSNCLDLKIRAI